jgi:hypothetical protein
MLEAATHADILLSNSYSHAFIWIQMLNINGKTIEKNGGAEILFLRVVARYRMTNHKSNEDTRHGLGITYGSVNTVKKLSKELAGTL